MSRIQLLTTVFLLLTAVACSVYFVFGSELTPIVTLLTDSKATLGEKLRNPIPAAPMTPEVTSSTTENMTRITTTTNTTAGCLSPDKCAKPRRVGDLYLGEFVSSPVACSNDTEVLIVIHSAWDHVGHREAIRSSWASIPELPTKVRAVFLTGLHEGRLSKDAKTSHDVITALFEDTYRNLTLKSVAMVDWTLQKCPNVRYLLKCDDDVYVNVRKLVKDLDSQVVQNTTHNPSRLVILGRIARGWPPIRSPKSKYYVSYDEFASSVYPSFMTGPAYVISNPTLEPLFLTALDTPWLSLEDVFLTGIVGGTKVGARLINWPEFLNNRATMSSCNAQQLISIHNVKPHEHQKLVKLSKLSLGRKCSNKFGRRNTT